MFTCTWADDLGSEVGIDCGRNRDCISPFVKHAEVCCAVIYKNTAQGESKGRYQIELEEAKSRKIENQEVE